MKLSEKIFGTHSSRELKRIMPLVDKIEELRPTMQAMTDEELKDQTRKFKERLAEGETLDDLLPEAFATVREASKRVLNMEHYRVQLIGGIILHQGRIAEMRTGEGKTLVSTCPAYLNALEGKGVHIVTVNDYLAKRDAEWMGKVHEFLGLKVGVILNSMKNDERREQYACDITYVTNNEDGFDYLRDNMVIYKEQLVQRELHYAIIDEVDSVLIDEARTPLIISGQSGKSTKLYEVCDILARQLQRGEASGEMTKMTAIMGEEIIETGDFIVNEKDKVVNLTEEGVKKVEKFFHIENLADPENLEIQHNIILALRAHNLIFPHHENEIAQSECANGCTFANYWMHNGYINVDNVKMSKSLGNFKTVREIADAYGYEVIRYFLISAHYRTPINYNLEIIEQCKSALERLYTCRDSLDFALKNASVDTLDDPQLLADIAAHRDAFITAMDDDLNTADGISAVFELVYDINTRILDKAVSPAVCQAAADLFDELCGVLGILYNRKSNDVDAEIESLIAQRQEARKNKDFATADRIRDELKERGILLKDTPQGVTWTKA